MKNFMVCIVIILTCLVQIFIEQDIFITHASSDTLAIRAYGDSIAYGYGLSDLSEAYPNVFANHYQKLTSVDFSSHAVSGDTTSDLLEILQPYINKTAEDMESFNNTDIIVLCIGANNVLQPALNSIPAFMDDTLSEADLNILLNNGVEQFKQDLPKILDSFKNKKIAIMTIYNPYKYLTLKDVSIDANSIIYESIIRSRLNNYEIKLQKLIDISMINIQKINNEIRNLQNDNITVVDIYQKFNLFSKTEYLKYINADVSKTYITQEETSNTEEIINKISANCDPHPTKLGHQQIANEYLKSFNLFHTSSNFNENELLIDITGPTNTNLTYKIFVINKNNNPILLEQTTNNNFIIEKSKLKNSTAVYIEIYCDNELIETTKPIILNKDNASNKYLIINICIIILFATILIAIIYYIVLKFKNKNLTFK